MLINLCSFFYLDNMRLCLHFNRVAFMTAGLDDEGVEKKGGNSQNEREVCRTFQ